ncbi:MAG: hypothetical protein J6I53_11580, partial [Treponema sp.]|nr:hypothetical protein [Treponema sp.]
RMDVEFCLHSCAKTDVKQGSGTKLNLCVRATASQIPYTHNLGSVKKRLRSVFSDSPKQLCCVGEFYVHGSCWKSVFVAANHSKLDIQDKKSMNSPRNSDL